MLKYYQIKDSNELHVLLPLTTKYENLNFSFSKKYLSELGELLSAKNAYQLFAKKEQDVVGYIAGAETIHPGYFTIYELFVASSAQRRGIGYNLTSTVIEYAKKRNLQGIITQTEFENIPAQKLYEKLGFKQKDNPEWTSGITYSIEFITNKK